MCMHGQRFEVKVGDFDSAIDLPRLQTNVSLVGQLQRSSPIGTPGYRPVEVGKCIVTEFIHLRLWLLLFTNPLIINFYLNIHKTLVK